MFSIFNETHPGIHIFHEFCLCIYGLPYSLMIFVGWTPNPMKMFRTCVEYTFQYGTTHQMRMHEYCSSALHVPEHVSSAYIETSSNVNGTREK